MTDKRKVTDSVEPTGEGVEGLPEGAEPRSTGDTAPAEGQPRAGLPVEGPEQRAGRLQSELEACQERHLRLAAEFDNFRKRVARERVETGDRAQAAFVMQMLEVLDDLDRVVGDQGTEASDQVIKDAVLLIDRKLRKELRGAGLERLDPVGQVFDPAEHEAVSALPPPDPSQDHTVSATFQTGYRFKGQLIRPARVQVYSDQGQA